jgi:hypothetical protein
MSIVALLGRFCSDSKSVVRISDKEEFRSVKISSFGALTN